MPADKFASINLKYTAALKIGRKCDNIIKQVIKAEVAMKSSDIILVIILILLVVIAAELAMLMGSGSANAKVVAESNRELVAAHSRLEQVMTGVGENLEIVVDKFCGDRKKK